MSTGQAVKKLFTKLFEISPCLNQIPQKYKVPNSSPSGRGPIAEANRGNSCPPGNVWRALGCCKRNIYRYSEWYLDIWGQGCQWEKQKRLFSIGWDRKLTPYTWKTIWNILNILSLKTCFAITRFLGHFLSRTPALDEAYQLLEGNSRFVYGHVTSFQPQFPKKHSYLNLQWIEMWKTKPRGLANAVQHGM